MNQKKSKSLFLISICVFGFSIHLTWELIQCKAFYIHLKVLPNLIAMIFASLGDITILCSAYAIVALTNKSLFWPLTNSTPILWVSFTFVSAALAEFIEYWAIQHHAWSYSSINPTILGISIIPIFQMVFINPMTVFIAKKFVHSINPL